MVSRARLKSILTGLALYAMAAAIVGYFGVNAYTGKYGLNARQELDQEIIALTSELAQLKRERARSEQRVSLLRSARIDPDMHSPGNRRHRSLRRSPSSEASMRLARLKNGSLKHGPRPHCAPAIILLNTPGWPNPCIAPDPGRLP